MAKAIKAIQCPKCGSPQKVEVRPDVFRCENCGTEYFLDNDDINVNYTVRPAATPVTAPARRNAVLGVIGGVALLLFLALRLMSGGGQTTPYAGPQYSVTTGASDEKEAEKYTFSADESQLFLAPQQQPRLFRVGERSYNGATKSSSYAVFTDAATGEVLQEVPVPIAAGSTRIDFDIKYFTNGELYCIANKTTVFQVNAATNTVKDVTKTLFQGQSELASGVATVEAGDDDYGDYFDIFTNDGRNLNFFPRTGTVYTKDGLYKARHGFESLRPGSPNETRFIFSDKSLEYPEEKLLLIKYVCRTNPGGPQILPRFSWDDDYGGSGIFTDADPHRKVLTTTYDLKESRVLSYADFTPGRLYFEPRVLCADSKYVLIAFKPTASPTAVATVQCLNARTGAIVFTRPLPSPSMPDEALRYPAGFALRDGSAAFVISLSGALTQPEKAL